MISEKFEITQLYDFGQVRYQNSEKYYLRIFSTTISSVLITTKDLMSKTFK